MSAAKPGGRIRAVDGLVVAAAALLVLKAASFLFAPSGPEPEADGLPRFAHVLAHARQNYVPPDPTTTGSVPDKPKEAPPAAAPARTDAAASPTSALPGSPAERAIRERLAERREELQLRAREIEARDRLAEEVERRLDARAEEMRKAEERRSGAAASKAEAESASLKPLVTMYETMKPKEAARVFERLPHDVLVPVVRQINPRKMAEIMAALTPEAAEKLTVALARPARNGGEARTSAAALPPGELPAIEPAAQSASSR